MIELTVTGSSLEDCLERARSIAGKWFEVDPSVVQVKDIELLGVEDLDDWSLSRSATGTEHVLFEARVEAYV